MNIERKISPVILPTLHNSFCGSVPLRATSWGRSHRQCWRKEREWTQKQAEVRGQRPGCGARVTMGWAGAEEKASYWGRIKEMPNLSNGWWLDRTWEPESREWVGGHQCALEGLPSKVLWLFHLGRLQWSQRSLKLYSCQFLLFSHMHVYFEIAILVYIPFHGVSSTFSMSQVFIMMPFSGCQIFQFCP